MLDSSGNVEMSLFLESASSRRSASLPRLSHPIPGRSLGATVARVERPIRQAIQLLETAVKVDPKISISLFGCTAYGPGSVRESDEIRLSWFLINATLLHAFATNRTSAGSFCEALDWFLGDAVASRTLIACFSQQEMKAAERELIDLQISEDLLDLLPYVIEPHGHVTRKSLETCKIAKQKRAIKKVSGVYYTPSDVADFMIRSIAPNITNVTSWLDPACGTGVFLRSVQRMYVNKAGFGQKERIGFLSSQIYGIDKSALATDLASFVLLSECALTSSPDVPPFAVWQKIKRNIVCMDALRLVPHSERFDLHDSDIQAVTLRDIFPTIGDAGFDRIVMNPPYTTIRVDKGLKNIWRSFSGVEIGNSADIQLAFTEMMWRFGSIQSAAVAVLPLSVGTNTTKSYLRLREELLCSPGEKEFLFFDREPQALFGEDIKTRSVIVFRHGGEMHKDCVRTSRLLKWTGAQRPTIFARDRLVPIDKSQCKPFIPKVGTSIEALIYRRLKSSEVMLRAGSFIPSINRIPLGEAAFIEKDIRERTLLVSSTAYNFVNGFFPGALPKVPPNPYSTSPLNALTFSSQDNAFAAYSALSSRICFWLWHVEGDGFHLTSDFLNRLPLWAAFDSSPLRKKMALCGRRMWNSAKERMIGSVNGGRQTYSFHCGHAHIAAMEVEKLLIETLGLSSVCTHSMDQFIESIVSIDGKRRTKCDESDQRRVA